MTRRQRPIASKTDCIRVRLWPRRGLRVSEEAALGAWLDDWRADQRWRWEGQTLAGEMHSPDELSISDVVEHFCALNGQHALARIELSAPHPLGQPQAAWLSVHRSNPNLQPLCRLYEEGLVPAEIVVRALGGFTHSSGPEQVKDTS